MTDELQREADRKAIIGLVRHNATIDREAIAGICAAIRAGCSERTAARAIGRDRTTVYRWKCTGREHREAGEVSLYTEFLDRYEHAVSETVAEAATVMQQKHIHENWKAAAWWLKVKDPATYNVERAGEVASEVAEALLHRIRERCQPATYEDVVTNALSDVIEVKP